MNWIQAMGVIFAALAFGLSMYILGYSAGAKKASSIYEKRLAKFFDDHVNRITERKGN